MQALPAGLGRHQPVPWGSREGRQSLFEIPRGISATFTFLLRTKLVSQISVSQLKTEILEQGKVQKSFKTLHFTVKIFNEQLLLTYQMVSAKILWGRGDRSV